MQLTKKDKSAAKDNLKVALTLATSALLGTTNANADENEWEFDTAFLYYAESDRVTASEGIFNAKKTFDDQELLNLKLTVDVLTGASANGAVAQNQVQTFTRPSGNGQYNVKAGDTPLDDTFKDTRVQINGQWTQPLNTTTTASIGGHISKEYDYLSLGVNGNLAYDFNRKNSTLSFGLSYFHDTFSPEGGIPVHFSSMVVDNNDSDDFERLFDATRFKNEDDKTTTDVLFGFTQVINRRMLMQFNYSYSVIDGYLTDPFKVLSVVDNNGITQDLVYEKRPDTRTKHSVFVQSKYHFDSVILDASYRYMADDWEIESHTIDSRFRIPLSSRSYIEPHLRLYQQTAADFYQPFISQTEVTPDYASADYRIGEMDAFTVGLEYGTKLTRGNTLSFRLEYYSQKPKDAGFSEPGVLKELDLYEEVNAVIAQVSYSF